MTTRDCNQNSFLGHLKVKHDKNEISVDFFCLLLDSIRLTRIIFERMNHSKTARNIKKKKRRKKSSDIKPSWWKWLIDLLAESVKFKRTRQWIKTSNELLIGLTMIEVWVWWSNKFGTYPMLDYIDEKWWRTNLVPCYIQ